MMNLLCFHIAAWLSAHAVRATQVTRIAYSEVGGIDLIACAGRTVVVGNVSKQKTADLEQIASAMRNSLCEILDPPFDDQFRIRLCWLGDEHVCGAVNPRYIRSVVPLVYVHYIEDHDGPERDEKLSKTLAELFLTELFFKLRRDVTQTVTRHLSCSHSFDNHHVVTSMQWNEFRQTFLREAMEVYHAQPSAEILYSDEMFLRMLDRKLIPVPHRIHEKMDCVFPLRQSMEGIARSASPKQSWSLLQRPKLRIHLFSDERTFVRYGGEMYNEIINDPKQIMILSAIDTQKLDRWWWYWYSSSIFNRKTQIGLERESLFTVFLQPLSDPEVLNNKNRLSRTLQILLRRMEQQSVPDLLRVLEEMASLRGLKTTNQVRGEIEKVNNVIKLVRNTDHRLYAPWSKEEGPKVKGLVEKSKLLDIWFTEWDAIVIAELGLRKADSRRFWEFYSKAVRNIWPGLAAVRTSVIDEDGLAQSVLKHWKAVEHFLDPSYTMNIVLLEGPELDQKLLRKNCLALEYSWKALKPSIEWIDYFDEDEEEKSD